MAVLDEAAPLRERETLGVVVGDDRLDRVEPTLASPGRDGLVERGAGTTAPVLGEHGTNAETNPGHCGWIAPSAEPPTAPSIRASRSTWSSRLAR